MAINLSKNRESLLSAWKDVLDDKTATDWALFGYEGQSYDLKVVSKGDGGTEELAEDLSSGKIMYAFCKVMDPKTSLPKFVLINWQGEGAPLVRKGTCANHIRDVNNFFKGAHVTLNARTEEEVDPDIIIDKVSRATGSAYSFKERVEPEKQTGPVGTVYKRVIAHQEINSQERDKFWEKEELEEKKRQSEERKRRDEERKKIDEEIKQRELDGAKAREVKVQERNRSINQIREAEKNTQNQKRDEEEKEKWERQMQDSVREEQERKIRSELMRKERSQEAQSVISSRTFDARRVFEQNTSAGQMQSRGRLPSLKDFQPPSLEAESPPPISAPPQFQSPVPEPAISTSPLQSPPPESNEGEHRAVPYTRNLLQDTVVRQESEYREGEDEQDWETPTLEAGPEIRDPVGAVLREQGQGEPATVPGESPYHQLAVSEQKEEYVLKLNGSPDHGLKACALYDYQAADATEISFDPGDVITNIDQIDEGWWQGIGPDGTYGLFPANYVELIN